MNILYWHKKSGPTLELESVNRTVKNIIIILCRFFVGIVFARAHKH